MSHDKEISGIIERGHRIASGLNDLPSEEKINATIVKQRPFFEGVVPGMSRVYDGTINLDISPLEFRILRNDYEVTCEWEDGIEETFWFVEASLRYRGRSYDALIYYPCPSPIKKHKNTAFEILAPWIEGANYGDEITLSFSSGQVELVDFRG